VAEGERDGNSPEGGTVLPFETSHPARRTGKDASFEAEALPHLRALYGTAFRLTRSAQDAEDLVQETMLRAYGAWHRYQPGTNAKAWLYTILHRLRTDAYRKMARTPLQREMDDEVASVGPVEQERVAVSADLETALATLPEVFREAVLLRDVEELSYGEIAASLEVPIGTVMSRIHRGRALLRSALREHRS